MMREPRSYLLIDLTRGTERPAERIATIADRVERLRPPGHRDPERFWREKTDLAAELRRLAEEVARG
jgi:hypothetical protein